MGKEKFVVCVDEETQSLIINSLLLMRNKKLEEGMDASWIGDVIVNICNAPKRKGIFRGEAYER